MKGVQDTLWDLLRNNGDIKYYMMYKAIKRGG